MGSQLYVAPGIVPVREAWVASGAQTLADVRAQLDAYAERLSSGDTTARLAAATLVKGWAQDEQLLAEPIALHSARQIVACDHSFDTWSTVEGAVDSQFETAVDAVTLGDTETLTRLLERAGTLATARSVYGHRATLLHYVAANGVEIRRQVVPSNAPDIARVLLDHGADPHATMPIYGGHYDTLSLMRSSAHPRAAGIAPELDSILTGA